MMNYEIVNKFSENFVRNWRSIVKSALHIFVTFLFWTMITVAYDWTFLVKANNIKYIQSFLCD